MALETNKQAIEALDEFSLRAARVVRQEYRKGVMQPGHDAVKSATNWQELFNAVEDRGLPRRMDETKTAKVLAEAMAQSALIGNTAAQPVRRKKGS
ncbi:MAG: hypothetical protein AABZ47_07880 [Planctomycetota bacterium]